MNEKQLSEVIEMLRRLEPRFYGHVDLTFIDGELTTVRKEQSFKPGQLIDRKRTINNGYSR